MVLHGWLFESGGRGKNGTIVDATRSTFNGVMLLALMMRASCELPPRLAPGDLIVVVAPSSPFPMEPFWRGLAWLRCRYRIRLSPGVLSRNDFLAGSDERRREELERAFTDPAAKAIVAIRGGYGAMRLVNDLPWAALSRRPKWLVGFSDITALHAMAWRAGVASVHGPNAVGLGSIASPRIRAAWVACLERPTARRSWQGLRVVHPGDATGVVVGGNLTILHAMAAAGRLTIPDGAVLALEDVGEAPYRVDRMLTSLIVGGHLARAAAIILGGFDRCAAGPDGRSVDYVLEERTRPLGIPVLAGGPFGHGPNNESFVLGLPARVRGDEVVLAT